MKEGNEGSKKKANKKDVIKVYLIRHAESTNNWRGWGIVRTEDPDVTALGEDQSYWLAQYFEKHYYDFEELYISPMLKTVRTSQPLVKMLQKRNPHMMIQVKRDLFEYGGVFQGERTLSEKER